MKTYENEPSQPNDGPVYWYISTRDDRSTIVLERHWYDARERGARELGIIDVTSLTCEVTR